MGSFTSKIAALFEKHFTEESRVLILGLDNAGKTAIGNKLSYNESVDTIPTVGFNVEKVRYKSVEFTLWDVGGQHKIRALWRHYFTNVNCLIWVCDATDKRRLAESAKELHAVLSAPELDGVPVLIYANKSDMAGSMGTAEIASGLRLSDCKGEWMVQASCAKDGSGLYEGLEWVITHRLRIMRKTTL